ncbi:DUF3047 domain-containing protein [Noviherbaspirillum aerium]|uniref:DUF3047 domain-containing protein n=1 Tax=Noviherbaspirillum aerium TaxID=2588497 RepID=UPI00124D77DD|nr:DUF3047 domain-containing protein [Noviherbaspirillum aerium]
MKRLLVPLALSLTLAGCAQQPKIAGGAMPAATAAVANGQDEVKLFSANPAGGLPHGWEPLILLRTKNQTHYKLVSKEDRTVLHARAEKASSGLMQKVDIDPAANPWLHWQWKIADLIHSADNTHHATEDSPVRIILGFDGDKDTLPFADQILFETARVMTGYEFPYATLMYIWENKVPVGTIIRSNHSSRIKMMVAARGKNGIGEWQTFTRNIVEDYEKAFGEKPGKLIGVGVLTDTDNTGEAVEAWYGDIRLMRERGMLAAGERKASPLVVGQGE